MVNLEIHEVPKSPEFNPDGYYVPRILFFSPQGRLLSDVNVRYNTEYKFNYPGEHYLLGNMKTVVEKFRPRWWYSKCLMNFSDVKMVIAYVNLVITDAIMMFLSLEPHSL